MKVFKTVDRHLNNWSSVLIIGRFMDLFKVHVTVNNEFINPTAEADGQLQKRNKRDEGTIFTGLIRGLSQIY